MQRVQNRVQSRVRTRMGTQLCTEAAATADLYEAKAAGVARNQGRTGISRASKTASLRVVPMSDAVHSEIDEAPGGSVAVSNAPPALSKGGVQRSPISWSGPDTVHGATLDHTCRNKRICQPSLCKGKDSDVVVTHSRNMISICCATWHIWVRGLCGLLRC